MRHEKLRIALYSHDTMGIGHMRRNLLIAQSFAASPLRPEMLMTCGAREAACFEPPPGLDYVTVPSLAKRADGGYHSRHLRLELRQLVRLRSEILRSALDAFEPDVLIVDKVPRGALRELDPALASLREAGTRIVLGLRDILDAPDVVADEWRRDDNERAIRDFYDAIWVYGSREVYDLAQRYRFSPDVAGKIRYAGYLQRFSGIESCCGGERHREASVKLPTGKIILCAVGGGQDGGSLAAAFAEAAMPDKTTGVIITGPFMPPEVIARLRALARGRRNLRVLSFLPDIESLVRRADRVVAMGGYNTVCELLSLRKIALVIPRTCPRREQLIRAQNMQGLGLLDFLRPERLTPDAIGNWLAKPAPPRESAWDQIDFNGLTRLPQLLDELLSTASTARATHKASTAGAGAAGVTLTLGSAHVA